MDNQSIKSFQLLKVAKDLIDSKDYDKGYILLETALEEYPNDYQIWYLLTRSLTKDFSDTSHYAMSLNFMKNTLSLAPIDQKEHIRATFLEFIDQSDRIYKEYLATRKKQLISDYVIRQSRKKKLILFSVVALVFMLTILFIPLYQSHKAVTSLQEDYDDYELRYSELRSRMLSVNTLLDLEKINNDIIYLKNQDFDYLPYEAFDLYLIEYQFNMIVDEATMIARHKDEESWKTPLHKKFTAAEFDLLRENYRSLYSFSQSNTDWDFTSMLSDVNIEMFLYHNELSSGPYFVEMLQSENTGPGIINLFPNDMEMDKQYGYYIRVEGRDIIIGYQNLSNYRDRFYSLKITIPLNGQEPFEYYNYYDKTSGFLS